jgi:uncharacterized OB-fold protein
MLRERPRCTAEALPFFRAAAAGRLELTYCTPCDRWIWFPRAHCPSCGEPTQWRRAVGTATLTSFAVERRATVPRWRDQTPYVIAVVRLDEGVTVLSNVMDAYPDALAIGDELTVDFVATDDPELAVPIFRRRLDPSGLPQNRVGTTP